MVGECVVPPATDVHRDLVLEREPAGSNGSRREQHEALDYLRSQRQFGMNRSRGPAEVEQVVNVLIGVHEPDVVDVRFRRLDEVGRDCLVRGQQVVPHHRVPLGLEDVGAEVQLVAVRVDESHEGPFGSHSRPEIEAQDYRLSFPAVKQQGYVSVSRSATRRPQAGSRCRSHLSVHRAKVAGRRCRCHAQP